MHTLHTPSHIAFPSEWGNSYLPAKLLEPDMDELDFRLTEILDNRNLNALFQPIIGLDHGGIAAYEGLIRGPSNSPLHSPLQLFRAAAQCNRTDEVEQLCRDITLESFVRLGLKGDLFLNVTPDCLTHPRSGYQETFRTIRSLGIDPSRIVIELTEHQPAFDYGLLRNAVEHYRSLGFRIAIDDLGEGFSSLRLWSELRPEFVKIDMHFIQGCGNDPLKKQFLQSIHEIARKSGCQVIAEGIETSSELVCVREIGIARGQGYFLGRPTAIPATVLSGEAATIFIRPARPARHPALRNQPTADSLMRPVAPITPSTSVEEVYRLLEGSPDITSLPVVDQGRPTGIISRYALIDRLARPFRRELFGRKPCHLFMNPNPVIVETTTSIHELGRMVAESDAHQLADGFIIVENGTYRGIGTGQDLMRDITQLQIQAAQHANALTGLPGNEPISTTIDDWLEANHEFWTAYCDLDNFKAYNDVYGFSRGDEAIRVMARAITNATNSDIDFVGHIGGDDFLILFASRDWEARCRQILDSFTSLGASLYSSDDLDKGGYYTENRYGERVFMPLISLSIGIVHIEPSQYLTHHQVSSAAAIAKKEAKKMTGNSYFLERRHSSSTETSIDIPE